VREIGLSAGDTVTLSPQPDRTLLISSEPKVEERLYRATIELFQGDDPEDNFRLLVAHYLVGYDIIKLVSRKGFSASDRKFIKDAARQRLIGLEVIEESRNELILQSLLNYRDLSLEKAMQSMSRLVASMLEDGYRLVTKSMERIGDHAELMAQNIIKLEHGIDESDLIFRMGVHVRNIFKDAVRSLAQNDVKHANRVIANSKKAVTAGASLAKKNRKNADPCISGTEMRSVIESLKRISEYSADIAEVSINMSIKELRDI